MCNSVNLKPGGIIEPLLKIVGDEYETFQRCNQLNWTITSQPFLSVRHMEDLLSRGFTISLKAKFSSTCNDNFSSTDPTNVSGVSHTGKGQEGKKECTLGKAPGRKIRRGICNNCSDITSRVTCTEFQGLVHITRQGLMHTDHWN